MDLTRAGELVWLMLPAYAANMAPPFAKYWRGWNRPISKRHLGSHKTVVGFALGIVAAVAAARLQSALHTPPDLGWTWWTFGLMQGVGAMAGDSAKSYFKRLRGLKPGARWVPADQLDFVAGALLLSAPALVLNPADVIVILAVTFFGHVVVNHVAYALRIRDTAW